MKHSPSPKPRKKVVPARNPLFEEVMKNMYRKLNIKNQRITIGDLMDIEEAHGFSIDRVRAEYPSSKYTT